MIQVHSRFEYLSIIHPDDLYNERVLDALHTFSWNPHQEGFRFSSALDAIHEKYPVHSKEYLNKRIERNQQKITAFSEKEIDQDLFTYYDLLIDDYHRLEKFSDAFRLATKKLTLQKQLFEEIDISKIENHFNYAKNLNQEEWDLPSQLEYFPLKVHHSDIEQPFHWQTVSLYQTYSRLGIILMDMNRKDMLKQIESASIQYEQGLEYLLRAIHVHPYLSIEKDVWIYLIAKSNKIAQDWPHFQEKFNFIGLDISEQSLPKELSELNVNLSKKTNPLKLMVLQLHRRNVFDAQKEDGELISYLFDLLSNKEGIAKISPSNIWCHEIGIKNHVAVPFNEPALAILKLWKHGSGPDPYLAMALGEIMVQVGQREIAWFAYRRAIDLSDRFNSINGMDSKMIAICEKRMQLLVESLAESDGLSDTEAIDQLHRSLENNFQHDLNEGLQFQQQMQEYEIRQIQNGVDPDDPNFYDRFYETKEHIESKPTNADQVIVIRTNQTLFLRYISIGIPTYLLVIAFLFCWKIKKLKSE